eukprot:30294-Pelagococcus_subviridis.AAC.75
MLTTAAKHRICTVMSFRASRHRHKNDFGGGYSNVFVPYAALRASNASSVNALPESPSFRFDPSFSARPSTPPAVVTNTLSLSVMHSSSAFASRSNAIFAEACTNPRAVVECAAAATSMSTQSCQQQ